MEADSVLHPPTFVNSEQRELPTLPAFEPTFEAPFIPQRPDVEEVGRSRTTPPSPQPAAPPTPATPYAPPPMGAQYDVPPPPGMVHVPTTGPVLPPSAFVAPQLPSTGWPPLPPVGSVPQPVAPLAPVEQEAVRRTPLPPAEQQSPRLGTVSSWLIGALPLFQFAAIYLVFGTLGVALAPGMQWGILAVPAAFSLLFANSDKKTLTARGASSPSLVFAIVPPLYLLVRCFSTGRSSVLPLIAWVLLQAAAAAGVYYLLPTVLAAAIRAIG